jgi:phosphoribosylformimino-5-aminoimidazole carboxamide ribotide isomerase
MQIFFAIDLLGGKAVRLVEGKRDRATIYHEDPPALVEELTSAGADRLHVVDLDGAFSGDVAHRPILEAICARAKAPVQLGGGLRDRAAIDAAIAMGASYVVLGTAAVRDPELVESVCKAYPQRVIVAVDARDGVVAIEGWTESGSVTALELGQRAAGWGAAALLYTDVARDGTGSGPNVEATAELGRRAGCDVIASGGVSSLQDLARLRDAGIFGVVVGRALYDKRFTAAEAVAVAHAPAGTPVGAAVTAYGADAGPGAGEAT